MSLSHLQNKYNSVCNNNKNHYLFSSLLFHVHYLNDCNAIPIYEYGEVPKL